MVFHDGTDVQMDRGRGSFGINITGIENSNYYDKMKWINTIMNNQENVLVSGLSDTNLNKYYYITDFSFTQNPAESLYHYNLILERLYEEI
jgi:hypothetical protein